MAHCPHPKKMKTCLQRTQSRRRLRTFCNSSNLGSFREVGGKYFFFCPEIRGENGM